MHLQVYSYSKIYMIYKVIVKSSPLKLRMNLSEYGDKMIYLKFNYHSFNLIL